MFTRIRAINHASELMPPVKNPNSALFGLQIDILQMMYGLNWLDESTFSSMLFNAIGGGLQTSFDLEKADRICSKDQELMFTEINVQPNSFPSARYSEKYFWKAMACLQIRGPAFAQMLVNLMRAKPEFVEDLSQEDISLGVVLLNSIRGPEAGAWRAKIRPMLRAGVSDPVAEQLIIASTDHDFSMEGLDFLEEMMQPKYTVRTRTAAIFKYGLNVVPDCDDVECSMDEKNARARMKAVIEKLMTDPDPQVRQEASRAKGYL